MCYGGMSLKDTVRDVEARVAPLVLAVREDRQEVYAAPGLLARLREMLAGWKRKDARHV
jgi:hypothetical protein